MSPIEADVVAEGERLLVRAREEGVVLRLLGGVAIRLRAEGGLSAVFESRSTPASTTSTSGCSR